MKYYYTDPLIVAYMAREFNIITEQGSLENGDYVINDRASFPHFLKEELPKTINSREMHQYYIYSNCLEMLKPQVGDVIICDYMGEVVEIKSIREDWCDFAGVREIIRRNGKAFFMPEVENG